MCRLLHLPSNAVIKKIALRDLDLVFEGEKLKIVISLKRLEVAQKWCEMHV